MKPIVISSLYLSKVKPSLPFCIGYLRQSGQDGYISGTVYRDGAPVAGANVRVLSRSSGSFITSVVSDADGRYQTLALVFGDRYTVCAIDPMTSSNAVVADNIAPERMM